MATRTCGEPLDPLERLVHALEEGRLSLQKIVADLATGMRRGFDQVAEQFAETDRRIRATDERIDKLVSAI